MNIKTDNGFKIKELVMYIKLDNGSVCQILVDDKTKIDIISQVSKKDEGLKLAKTGLKID